MYERDHVDLLRRRLLEPRRFIQALTGPRQTGKTTIAQQVASRLPLPAHFVSADEPNPHSTAWIREQWDIARTLAARAPQTGALLILDEVQKISDWSSAVKSLWDRDARTHANVKVLLLVSSPLLLQRGLKESLAGRFEVTPVSHWSYGEMRSAFKWTFDRYVLFGGFPGAVPLLDDEHRWKRYIVEALIETTIAKDVLLLSRIDKPALLRQLFHLSCSYSGQIVTYQKLVGQLQDAGNTTTIAHYLELLDHVGMITPLAKYSGQEIRQRASSPKLMVRNTALLTALSSLTPEEIRATPEAWGRQMESAVGAHLVNSASTGTIRIHYWREGPYEVDFVLAKGKHVTAVEVKSGKRKSNLFGMELFLKRYPHARTIIVGPEGVDPAEFMSQPAEEWM